MNTKQLYLRLLTHVRPYWRVFAVAVLGTVVLAATEPAMPALMKPLLDGSFVNKDETMIWLIPLALVGVFAVRGAATFTSTVGMAWVANKVVLDLRERMFGRLLTLPTGFFDDNATGVILSKVTFDVNQVTDAATKVLVILVRDSLAIIGLLALMLYLNWRLALIALVLAPVITLVVKMISRRLRSFSRAVQRSMGDLTHVLEEAISGHKVVKLYGGQPYESGRFHDIADRVRRYMMKAVTVAAYNVPIVQLITVIGLAVIIYLAGRQSAAGELTVGSFVSFFGAMALLFSPIKRLTSINEQLQKGLAAAESVFGLIDQLPEPDRGTRVLERARGQIEFRDVSFGYASGHGLALADISLSVRPGEHIALVGASGSGKSTLVNLIPRFYCPSSGALLIDGIDIRDLTLEDLRRQIALVSQDIVLFNDSVGANIAYGESGRHDSQAVLAAARTAHAYEFIETMPEQFETLVGENGVRLSGGQKQRLAIARALFKDAPILIFDEATSALDSESERYIQEAMEVLKQGRTTITIAHRLSTVEKADRIVVMERGRIVETGTHTELLGHKGTYARLHRLQFSRQDAPEPAPGSGGRGPSSRQD